MATQFELSRSYWDFAFNNPDMVNPTHAAIFFFAIEQCNRLGWKEKFGLPATMVLEAIGIKSYNTYKKCFDDLVEWGFFLLHTKSKNQYSSNIIALSNASSNALSKNNKALDKALTKHATKQSESTIQSTDSIDKQDNNKQVTNNDDDVNARDEENSNFKFPINVPPVEPYLPLSEIFELFKSGKYANTREQLCIKYQLPNLQAIIDKATEFNLSLTCQGVSTKQISEWIRHFNNWIPKAGGFAADAQSAEMYLPDFKPTDKQLMVYRNLIDWMARNTPAIARMEQKLTVWQVAAIIGDIPHPSTGIFKKIDVSECYRILLNIENNKEYLKKYRSPYLCLLNWSENKK